MKPVAQRGLSIAVTSKEFHMYHVKKLFKHPVLIASVMSLICSSITLADSSSSAAAVAESSARVRALRRQQDQLQDKAFEMVKKIINDAKTSPEYQQLSRKVQDTGAA